MAGLRDKAWEVVQIKTFTKWFNAHLKKGGHTNVVNELAVDIKDGILLHKLLESISSKRLKPINQKPRMRLQMIENLNVSLAFINQHVKLVGISAEELCDGNLKLILGMIWMIILRFEISEISVEDLSAKEGLLLWCQKKTAGYRGVEVRDFTRSWHDGLAFCALIHRHRPDLLDYDSLSAANGKDNLELAFSVAEKSLNIARFLDPDDVPVADERSVMTYLLQFFRAFSEAGKAEVAGRRISKQIAFAQAVEEQRLEYERGAKELLDWLAEATLRMRDREFDNTLEGARSKIADLGAFQTDEKPPKAALKLQIEGTFANLQVKLRNAKRTPYAAPAGMAPEDVERAWTEMCEAERERDAALRAELARQERMEALSKRFFEKLAKLLAWAAERRELLDARPAVDSVIAAQSQLALLDGIDRQLEASGARVEDLRKLGAELVGMGYRDSDRVNAALADVDSHWTGLRDSSGSKRTWAEGELERQKRMEQLRLAFAEGAKAYERWTKDESGALSAEAAWGDSLEDVTAASAGIEKSEGDLRGQSASKSAELERLWSEMQELGVKDNRYTLLTIDDVHAHGAALEAAVERRREAYEAELKRQQEMEAKRIEFARAAEAVDAAIKEQREAIDALEGEDPQALAATVEETHAAGAKERGLLAEATRVGDEAIGMRITSNKHTHWTVPALEAAVADEAAYVRRYLDELREEHRLRNDYDERAQRIISWVSEASEGHASREIENTLEGARKAVAAYTAYRTSVKPPKTAEKAAVLLLHDRIVEVLSRSTHHRGQFVPREGLRPADISAAWAQLEQAETARGEWAVAELRRHERLASLARRVAEDAGELQAWCDRKAAYLRSSENPEGVEAAQALVKRLTAYNAEYHASESRATALTAGVAELEAGGYEATADMNARVSAVLDAWKALPDLEAAKAAALKEALALEEKREHMRVQFAEKVRAFNAWVIDTEDDLASMGLGDGLEGVRGSATVVEQRRAAVDTEATQHEAALTALLGEMAEIGVTSNRHTSATAEDVARTRERAQAAAVALGERYARELERQERMEAKRLEYAAAARACADAIAAEHAEIDAMTGEDPVELSRAIAERHAEGAALKQLLADAERINAEALQLEVTENRHTDLPVRVLQRRLREHSKFVVAYLSELEAEATLRAEYARRAGALAEWASSEAARLPVVDFDNTLAGAQARSAEHAEWSGSDQAARAGERDAVQALFERVVASLKASSHHRLEFNPAAEHAPASLDAAMEAVAEAAKKREVLIAAELERQERLRHVSRDLDEALVGLGGWCRDKAEHLQSGDHAESVQAAQIQADLLEAFTREYEAEAPRAAHVQQLSKQLEDGGYIAAAEESAKAKEVLDLWESLPAMRDQRSSRVGEDATREVAKEELRVALARAHAEFERWAVDEAERIDKYAFGTTLEDVRATKAKLDANAVEVTAEADKHAEAIAALWARLAEAGVTENVHTRAVPDDGPRLHAVVTDALARRAEAYGKELERQEAMEAKRLEFAHAAKELAEAIAASKAKLDAVSGEPEEAAATARAAFGDAEKDDLHAKLTRCEEVDAQARELKVVDNKHTPYTLPALTAMLSAHEQFHANLLASIDSAVSMRDRQREREAEWARKENAEKLRSDYATVAARVSQWIDNVDEAVGGDAPVVDSLTEVENLAAEHQALDFARAAAEEDWAEAEALAQQAIEADPEAGAPGHLALSGKWAAAHGSMDERASWIASERVTQQKRQEAREAFAAEANAIHEWIEAQKLVVPPEGTELEAQLAFIMQLQQAASAEGDKRLARLGELNAAAQAVGAAGRNPLTQLTPEALASELGTLSTVLKERASVIEKQIASAKFGSLTQEEVAEYREIFNQFDKDKSGNLRWFEFKGLLQAIGEDMSDDEVKATVDKLAKDNSGTVDFAALVEFLRKKRTDQDTSDEIREAFRSVAGGKDFITATDLAPYVTPEQLTFLKSNAPAKDGVENGIDFSKWTDAVFQ